MIDIENVTTERAYLELLRERVSRRPVVTDCLVCGRELSDPRSAENGIGPICRRKGETAAVLVDEESAEVDPEA